MKTVTINWALIGSIVAAVAGVVGSVLTPIYGKNLSGSVEAVLQAVSGLLVLIPTWHVGSTAAYTAKMRLSNTVATQATIPENFARPQA